MLPASSVTTAAGNDELAWGTPFAAEGGQEVALGVQDLDAVIAHVDHVEQAISTSPDAGCAEPSFPSSEAADRREPRPVGRVLEELVAHPVADPDRAVAVNGQPTRFVQLLQAVAALDNGAHEGAAW